MQRYTEFKKEAHPDYANNLSRAHEYIDSLEGKLPNGVNVQVRSGEGIPAALLAISFTGKDLPTFASNISLHQGGTSLTHEANEVMKRVLQIARSYGSQANSQSCAFPPNKEVYYAR